MLDLFDNETDNGKLYISYPMIESISHFTDHDSFKDAIVKCKGINCEFKNKCDIYDLCLREKHYKEFTNNNFPHRTNINKYNVDIWKEIIKANLMKMNFLINNNYTYPKDLLLQKDIFQNQWDKFINKRCPV